MIHQNFVRRVSAYLLLVLFVFMNLSTSVFAVITDGADAIDQIGQPDFDTGTSGTGADEFNFDWYTEIDTVNHRLFVADAENNRVQVFNLDNSNELIDKIADNVLGQNFVASDTAPSSADATNIGYPTGLSYDSANDRLFVGDEGYHRVLIYDVATITNGEAAQYVLGQNYFASSSAGTTQSKFAIPEGIDYDSVNDRLFVAEYTNKRVTVFDVSPAKLAASATGAGESVNASAVIGQNYFESSTGGVAQNKFDNLYDVEYTGSDAATSRLFVADSNNNRVMIFSASEAKLAASATGAGESINAKYVLGQSDFVTATQGTTQNTLNYPGGLSYDTSADLLFVSEGSNNRITIFDASIAQFTASGSGYNASNVFGQSNFTSGTGATAVNRLKFPWGSAIDSTNNKLYVTDSSNNRVMIFDISGPPPIPEFSTTVFSLVLLVLGFAIFQKSGGFKKLMGTKV